ncbi:toprim domain-containing protein [Bulleidia sp. zg-1006]|uniref:toprim domain-containing protein n=1 Tax=Bulleidia sp. zg-1006 TaxID=2806552 RepID=UPI00193A1C8A|nr:toprim domain-containing protein [Bulleidia sp. zg-1006]QRG86074.1 toprim domain-containing protein [Bulleidia sp. zg-1006]
MMAKEKVYKFTPSRMQLIREKLDFVEVAQRFYQLTPITRGYSESKKNYTIPKHDSVIIFSRTNSFYRYSTQEGGDIVKFLQVMPEIKMSFKKAFNYCFEQVAHLEEQTMDDVEEQRQYHSQENIEKKYEEMKVEVFLPITNLLKIIREESENNPKLQHLYETEKAITWEHIYKEYGKDKTKFQYPKKYNEIYKHLKQIVLKNLETKQFQNTHKNAIAYLIKERKINADLVFDLLAKGFIHQSNRTVTLEDGITYQNRYVSFTNLDKKGNIDSIMSRICSSNSQATIQKYESPYNAGNGWLLDKHLNSINKKDGYHGISSEEKPLIIFEAVIDMLSFMSYMKERNQMDKYAYLALGGLKKKVLENILQDNEAKYTSLVLAVDNDDKGDLFAEKMMEKYEGKYPIKRIKSQYKDWNEDRQKGVIFMQQVKDKKKTKEIEEIER